MLWGHGQTPPSRAPGCGCAPANQLEGSSAPGSVPQSLLKTFAGARRSNLPFPLTFYKLFILRELFISSLQGTDELEKLLEAPSTGLQELRGGGGSPSPSTRLPQASGFGEEGAGPQGRKALGKAPRGSPGSHLQLRPSLAASIPAGTRLRSTPKRHESRHQDINLSINHPQGSVVGCTKKLQVLQVPFAAGARGGLGPVAL